MVKPPITIRLTPPIDELLQGIRGEDGRPLPGKSVNGRLSVVCARYMAIMERHGLELKKEEADVLSAFLEEARAEPLLIRHLADEVRDSEFTGSPAADQLIAKLRGASFADLVATVERLGF